MADNRLYESMMRKALRLARKGAGRTRPNPIVGAVVFDEGGVIATGYHKKCGSPHAEAEALAKAGKKARGANIAVTLEPCCHRGHTGPCTDAIIRSGIRRVIYAIQDPFPKVSGHGHRILSDNGIEVISGVCAEEARRTNEAYLTYVTTGRPFVVLKVAQSLDGRLATRDGHSRWISCPQSLKFAHRLRSESDAIVVGGETVRTDNPQLTVRHVKGENPLRIILTLSGNLPENATVLKNTDQKTIIATTRENAAKFKETSTWTIRRKGSGLDLDSLLEAAGRHQIMQLMFEGGGQLGSILLKNRLVDKYFVVIAPMVIGIGINSVDDLGVRTLDDALRFRESSFSTIGTDILFTGYPERN